MSLEVYQSVFCRMVASAAFRQRMLERPAEVLEGLELSDRERRRLLAIAAQPGMRVSTAIHRANRLTPLDQTLPFTCFLLGDQLGDLVDRYWTENPTENLQLPAECERFASFLTDRISLGLEVSPYLEEVLAFERACTELRFFTEAELRRRGSPDGLPPQIRIVTFRHDPEVLLRALARLELPPTGLPQGEYHLAIDCRSGTAEFRLIDRQALAAIRELCHSSSRAG